MTSTDPFGLADLPDPLRIEPLPGPLDVVVRPPGSKSITNRALICAALADGPSTLRGALNSDDTVAMLGILRSLGIAMALGADQQQDDDLVLSIVGTAGAVPPSDAVLDCRQSGTTSRFVLPMLTLGTGSYEVTADAQMRARPMATTFAAIEHLGATVDPRGKPGHLPVRLTVGGDASVHRERATVLEVPGGVSSQFLSGLLLAAPCVPHGLVLVVEGELVSRPYVDLTISVMAAFGATVSETVPNRFVVEPTGYRGTTYEIEPDASAASYPLAAAALCGGRAEVDGLSLGSSQGDVGFAAQLERMGAVVESDGDARRRLTVTGPETGILHGGTFDFTHISDTAQTLAVLAPFADSPVTITGIGFIRRKEIDRIEAVATELRRCGVRVDVDDDGWTIHPGPVAPATIETYDDHRMAMSFALLGLRVPGMRIAGPGCVAKTFPGYWDMLEQLRASTDAR